LSPEADKRRNENLRRAGTKTVIPNLQSRSKPDVIRELAENLATAYPNINDEKLIEVLMEREKLCSTAVDSGWRYRMPR
jgi:mannitol/fructose-specific phosphotransferase system IIA component (Ntr-type)